MVTRSESSWRQTRLPFEPLTSSPKSFLWPMAIWLARTSARPPFDSSQYVVKWSSSCRPFRNVSIIPRTRVTSRPVTNRSCMKAWLPMSPPQQLAPACFGSVRHDACIMPVVSNRVASQPCR